MKKEGEVEEGFICQIDPNRPPILMVEIEGKVQRREVVQQQRQEIKSLSEPSFQFSGDIGDGSDEDHFQTWRRCRRTKF